MNGLSSFQLGTLFEKAHLIQKLQEVIPVYLWLTVPVVSILFSTQFPEQLFRKMLL